MKKYIIKKRRTDINCTPKIGHNFWGAVQSFFYLFYIIIFISVLNLDLSIIKGFSNLREAFYLVRLAGFEPAHPVPETGALSPEL